MKKPTETYFDFTQAYIYNSLNTYRSEKLFQRINLYTDYCGLHILLFYGISYLRRLFDIKSILVDEKLLSIRRCPWCNGYRRRKWTRQHEFKSWTRQIAFHIALIHLRKV